MLIGVNLSNIFTKRKFEISGYLYVFKQAAILFCFGLIKAS